MRIVNGVLCLCADCEVFVKAGYYGNWVWFFCVLAGGERIMKAADSYE